jgi:hypothetical protein
MSTKFIAGDEILHNGENKTIVVSSKNFNTNKISYLLSDGEKVAEEELKAVSGLTRKKVESKKKDNQTDELDGLHTTYQELIGKQVPVKFKNDLDWIKEKIEVASKGIAAVKEAKETPYQTLSKLNREQLIALIDDKSMPIDPEDYEEDSELLVAICQEMEIAISEAEKE